MNRWWNTLPEDGDAVKAAWSEDVSLNKPRKDALIKNAILQAYCWVVWSKRNEMFFRDGSFNPLLVANGIQSLVYSWVCNRGGVGKPVSWHVWSCNSNYV